MRASENCMMPGMPGLPYRGKCCLMIDGTRGRISYRFKRAGRFHSYVGVSGSTIWGQKQLSSEKKFGRSMEDYAQYGSTLTYPKGGRGRGTPAQGCMK